MRGVDGRQQGADRLLPAVTGYGAVPKDRRSNGDFATESPLDRAAAITGPGNPKP